MTEYQEARFTSRDGLTLFYRDYASVGARASDRVPVLCLPGMTRNSKDFEDLAPHLARTRRVLSADLRGRGRSDPDPEIGNYNARTYVDDVWELLDHAGVADVVVVGTSLGGIMAMLMATLEPGRVRGVILNDIGPKLEQVGLDRIAGYVGRAAEVRNWDDAALAIQEPNQAFYPDFGPDDWMKFARRTYVENERTEDGCGGLRPDYDPGIGDAMRAAGGGPTEMWPLFDALKSIPALVLRGELSDLLSAASVDRMVEIKPDLVRATIPRRGHVPALDEPESLAAIDGFLERYF